MVPSGIVDSSVFGAEDMAEIRRAVDAVCEELSIDPADQATRERIAGNIMRSWSLGHRTPLGLVQAGLDGAA